MRIHTEEMNEYIRENLRYDLETGHLWWIKPSENGVRTPRNLNKPVGTLHHEGYFRIKILSTNMSCHRTAWFLYYGHWPKGFLDHINGVKTDNRVENLRLATNKENLRNQKSRKGSSKYKGVSWQKGNQKWRSCITVNERKEHLGYYASEEAAAYAYDKAAREQFGDYACLNFPEEYEQGALNGHDV